MAPRIWLDCTSLMDWQFSHLTGIQRTILGLHKGWRACGIEPRLVRYHMEMDCFVEVDPWELPDVIYRNMKSLEWVSVTPAPNPMVELVRDRGSARVTPTVVETKKWSLPRRMARRVLGAGPMAEDLRQALAGINFALWRLGKSVWTWLPQRVGLGAVAEEDAAKPDPLAAQDMRHLCLGEGDILFSIGSECFQVPANPRAARQLKAQGAMLVRMIYDVIPVTQPQWVTEEATRVFRDAVTEVIRSSDHILTISEYSRNEILRFAESLGQSAPPITAIRLGDELPVAQVNQLEVPPEHERPSRPFFLCIGTLEPRKNHRLLYDVWRRIAIETTDECPDLVCIGALTSPCRQIVYEMTHDPLVKERIHVLHEVSDTQLEWYYRNCLATVFPSLYEGWGLPVAESLARGKFCLASNATSIPEISADLPAFFSPSQPEDLLGLIRSTMNCPSWKEAGEERIRVHYRPSTWSSSALQVLRALDLEAAFPVCNPQAAIQG